MSLSFGEKVRILREEKNLNQTEMGKLLNMTQRKISYIECNRYEPSIDDIKALCEFFQVSSDYLIGIKKGLSYPNRLNDKSSSDMLP